MRADSAPTGDISLKFIRINKCNLQLYIYNRRKLPEFKKEICAGRLKGLKVVTSIINQNMHTEAIFSKHFNVKDK